MVRVAGGVGGVVFVRDLVADDIIISVSSITGYIRDTDVPQLLYIYFNYYTQGPGTMRWRVVAAEDVVSYAEVQSRLFIKLTKTPPD